MSQSKNNLISDIAEFLDIDEEVYGPHTVSSIGSDTTQIQSPDRKAESDEYDSHPEPVQAEEPAPAQDAKKPQMLGDKLGACKTLEELKILCEEADELRTDLDGTNLVLGVGNPKADLMLIGEAPGQEEDRQGEPFVGVAGQLLNKILAAINFERDDVYIANILKHRPPGNRNPNPDERIRSLPYLLRQIELIQPKIILCLGKVSGTTLLKKETTLKSLRGQFYPFHGTELTVTYHPAALLRNPHWKRPAWEDVQKVRQRYDELRCKP